jgi:hypothetical protein
MKVGRLTLWGKRWIPISAWASLYEDMNPEYVLFLKPLLVGNKWGIVIVKRGEQ